MLDGDAAGDSKGVVLRAANQNRSIAGGNRSIISAIGSECLAPDDFFGYFLVRKQESNTCHQFDKLKFEHFIFSLNSQNRLSFSFRLCYNV